MLEYSLYENLLTDRKDDRAAKTHSKAVYTRDGFIDLMLERGSMVTKTDIVAVLNDIEETVAYILRNGGTLNLPLFNTSFSISGVFESAMDVFDPSRHKLHINLHKGVLLREVEKEVKLVKENVPVPQPQILEVIDSVSGKVDEVLTPGAVVIIDGINIKLSGKKPEVGLYFVNSATKAETKAATVVTNKPSQIIAMIPQLEKGSYQLKIATQYSSGKGLNNPKTTVYGKTLTVK